MSLHFSQLSFVKTIILTEMLVTLLVSVPISISATVQGDIIEGTEVFVVVTTIIFTSLSMLFFIGTMLVLVPTKTYKAIKK